MSSTASWRSWTSRWSALSSDRTRSIGSAEPCASVRIRRLSSGTTWIGQPDLVEQQLQARLEPDAFELELDRVVGLQLLTVEGGPVEHDRGLQRWRRCWQTSVSDVGSANGNEKGRCRASWTEGMPCNGSSPGAASSPAFRDSSCRGFSRVGPCARPDRSPHAPGRIVSWAVMSTQTANASRTRPDRGPFIRSPSLPRSRLHSPGRRAL